MTGQNGRCGGVHRQGMAKSEWDERMREGGYERENVRSARRRAQNVRGGGRKVGFAGRTSGLVTREATRSKAASERM